MYGLNFYTLPATARSHPTDHHGPSTLSENIKRNKYSYKIQERGLYRGNVGSLGSICLYNTQIVYYVCYFYIFISLQIMYDIIICFVFAYS